MHLKAEEGEIFVLLRLLNIGRRVDQTEESLGHHDGAGLLWMSN